MARNMGLWRLIITLAITLLIFSSCNDQGKPYEQSYMIYDQKLDNKSNVILDSISDDSISVKTYSNEEVKTLFFYSHKKKKEFEVKVMEKDSGLYIEENNDWHLYYSFKDENISFSNPLRNTFCPVINEEAILLGSKTYEINQEKYTVYKYLEECRGISLVTLYLEGFGPIIYGINEVRVIIHVKNVTTKMPIEEIKDEILKDYDFSEFLPIPEAPPPPISPSD